MKHEDVLLTIEHSKNVLDFLGHIHGLEIEMESWDVLIRTHLYLIICKDSIYADIYVSHYEFCDKVIEELAHIARQFYNLELSVELKIEMGNTTKLVVIFKPCKEELESKQKIRFESLKQEIRIRLR